MSFGLLSEYLPHTNQAPVEIVLMKNQSPKGTFSVTVNRSMSSVFRDKQWTCMNVVTYYNKARLDNSYNFPRYSNALTYNLLKYVGYKDGLVRDSQYRHQRRTHDHIAILVNPDFTSTNFWEAWGKSTLNVFNLYTNFKILILDENQVCALAFIYATPWRRNFNCRKYKIDTTFLNQASQTMSPAGIIILPNIQWRRT